jgi:triosephosphate isomerase (TIM)
MKLFVANWKMHKTRAGARAFAQALGRELESRPASGELVVAPPLPLLDAAADPAGRWSLGCQDVSAEREGAFTGQVSAAQCFDAGARWAILGHSERRRDFGEDAPLLARKLARCREAGVTPVFCVGESSDQRDAGETGDVLRRELAPLAADPPDAALVVAYEPIWAIGSGRSARPEDAASARAEILRLLPGRRSLRVLYGGSVTSANARSLLEGSGMDGFLIGGASLVAEEFAAIARA